MDGSTLSVERVVAAQPAAIFALLSDASKHQTFDGSGTVRDARGSTEPLRLGSVFGMSMKQGLPYSTKNEVVEYEQDRLIAWQTSGLFGLIGGRIWRYELEPVEGGTRLRETWDLSRDKQGFLLKRSSLPAKTEKAMSRSLERIEKVLA